MTYDVDAFARAVLAGIQAPITAANLAAFRAWHTAEGGSAAYNPLNTTQPAAGDSRYNAVGVRNYPDFATGVHATVVTLLNGFYPGIVAAFRRGANPWDVANQRAELATWGTGDGVIHALSSGAFGTWPNGATPTPQPPAPPAPTPEVTDVAVFVVHDPRGSGTWLVAGDLQSKVPAESGADASNVSQAPGAHYLTLSSAQLDAIPTAS